MTVGVGVVVGVGPKVAVVVGVTVGVELGVDVIVGVGHCVGPPRNVTPLPLYIVPIAE